MELAGEEANLNLESPAAEFISCRPIITDAAGDTAFSYARSWISQCHSNHEHCKKQTSVALPSRLIDVEIEQDTPWVKLHTSEPNGELGSYAALSYCWGGPQPVVASTESLEKLKAGIAVMALPQTIKDAVEVTRKLGLRYLWVDALCIIQDCPKDKETEIQRMGLIYKNATVTIAASAATSATDGFLRIAREPPKSYPFQLPMHDGTTEEISLSTYHFLDPEDPLDTRGWAFQERLLSPRLLQFSGIELFWTCQTEAFKTISNGVIYYMVQRNRLPSRLFNNELRGGKSWRTPRQRIEMWTKVVSEYSKRKLTCPEDRLPALLGIVAELKEIWKDEYVYGLWKECMVSLLGWRPSEKQLQRSCRAPSWSWASLDGSISFQALTQEDAILLSTGVASVQQKSISLNCKIHDEEPLSKGLGIWKSLDLYDEYPNKRIYYLLLGTKKTRKSKDHIGLMVINMAPGLFRRVGYFATWREGDEIWSARERQEVILE